jgi:hypothetical protein
VSAPQLTLSPVRQNASRETRQDGRVGIGRTRVMTVWGGCGVARCVKPIATRGGDRTEASRTGVTAAEARRRRSRGKAAWPERRDSWRAGQGLARRRRESRDRFVPQQAITLARQDFKGPAVADPDAAVSATDHAAVLQVHGER